MQFYHLLPLGQVHIFPRQVATKQHQFANDIILHKIFIIDKVSRRTTTVPRLQSERKSKGCAEVHVKRTDYVVRVFLTPRNELLCGDHDNAQVFVCYCFV